MNVAIIGAGAIGSVVAGYLTKAGGDVVLIGRPNQVAAIERNGLALNGVRGDEIIQLNVLPKLDQKYGLVIFTVKTQDIEAAFKENKEFLNSSFILSSQNGVQADSILREYVPQENIFSSIVMFGSTYTKPGEATFNFEGDWIIGKPFGGVNEKTNEIARVLKKAFPVVVTKDIIGMKWLKLFVNFNNCIPALIGQSMQETFADSSLCRLSIMLLKEGVDIVQQAGIKLVSLPQFPVDRMMGLVNMPIDQASEIINKTLTTLSKEPLYGSILQSIMRKRTSEIDYINGEVVRLAEHNGMEVPLNKKIVELVHQVELNQKYLNSEVVRDIFHLSLKKAY